MRACAEPICAALEHGDQVALLRMCQRHSVGKQIKRGTERANDGSKFIAGVMGAAPNNNRVVLADYLAEVS